MTSPSTMASFTDRGERDLGEDRPARGVRDRDELDQAAADVQADRRRIAPEESHTCPLVEGWLRPACIAPDCRRRRGMRVVRPVEGNRCATQIALGEVVGEERFNAGGTGRTAGAW